MKIEDNIANEFDSFSKNYTNDMIGCVPHYLTLMSCFTEQLPKKFNPTRILDIGCGNGNVTSKLLSSFPDAEYTLLDASQEMLRLCQKRFKNSTIEYVASYFNDFNFKEDYFDLIVAGFSLHHCDANEKKNLFLKIYKSLNKEGIFSCSDLMINKDNPQHPIVLQEWKAFVNSNFPDEEKWQWLKEHYDEFDKPDDYNNQLKWLKEAGFKSTEITITTRKGYWVHLQAVKG